MKKFVVIDLFCGAGGTSIGYETAEFEGESVAEVIACVNHDELAIKSHAANHPKCLHFIEDIRTLDVHKLPRRSPGDERVWILWASLECTNYSNAKSGPRDQDSRTLAYALYPYIDWISPDLIKIENVREFMAWGDLDENGRPVDRLKGRSWIAWVQNICNNWGYRHSHRLLNSADFGSHQSRTRYFGVFAKPSIPIVFPEPTHDKNGRYGLKRWKPVKDVLDLEDEGVSIFNRKKDLVPRTLERILAGLLKFVPKNEFQHIHKYYGGNHIQSLDQPGPTVTTVPHEAIVTAKPFLVKYYGNSGAVSCDKPCGTITTKDRFGVVFMDNQFGTGVPSSIEEPCRTLTSVVKRRLVGAHFIDGQYGCSLPQSVDVPCRTITANPHHALLSVIKSQYLFNPQYQNKGASIDVPCFTLIARMDKSPPSIVTATPGRIRRFYPDSYFKNKSVPVYSRIAAFMAMHGIADIKMRMLKIPELKQIQGFPKEYVLHGSSTNQKKFIGNAVEPNVVRAWAKAYYEEMFKGGQTVPMFYNQSAPKHDTIPRHCRRDRNP